MRPFSFHKLGFLLLSFVLLIVCVIVVELVMIKRGGIPVAVPDIPRRPEAYGTGQPLTYVVMGDSTTVSQGGDYDQGIARSTARVLARNHTVTLHNFGISGARAGDVRTEQLPKAVTVRPDVVLLAVTANDVTHFTSLGSIRRDLEAILEELRRVNPEVQIVLTGAPQMGSIPRFPEPLKSLARHRTAQINEIISDLDQPDYIHFARIAEETGPAFLANPDLFAQDRFHPTKEGYELWNRVLEKSFVDVSSRLK
ncbi:MAG TPA: SGNH/GDSL hydrolase family protein [Candidatus Limnocylindrales bacterium]|nr:SGNH/GDSL hydrolase family protein [Candidatus Limnocylindrales bacterium]